MTAAKTRLEDVKQRVRNKDAVPRTKKSPYATKNSREGDEHLDLGVEEAESQEGDPRKMVCLSRRGKGNGVPWSAGTGWGRLKTPAVANKKIRKRRLRKGNFQGACRRLKCQPEGNRRWPGSSDAETGPGPPDTGGARKKKISCELWGGM